jgi:hypothetical protein
MDAVPAAWFRFAPVGHRPPRRTGRAGQQQPQMTAGDLGERGHRAESQAEPEVLGVEVDGRLHVVDHVPDADQIVIAICHG